MAHHVKVSRALIDGIEKNDPRNKLFLEYFNFIDALKPKVVLIENVRGILTMNNGYTKNKIISLFKDSGYKLTHAATLILLTSVCLRIE